jgi:hypothetical protein
MRASGPSKKGEKVAEILAVKFQLYAKEMICSQSREISTLDFPIMRKFKSVCPSKNMIIWREARA